MTCMKNDLKLNQTKCKDMIISFALEHPKLDPIFIEEHEFVPVSSAKILGMYISVDLKWNTHITHIVSKASKRLYFLRLLKRSGVDRYSLLTVFTTCIRPVLEWSYGTTQYLSNEIERIQKRALKIIHPDLSYGESLKATLILSLSQRRHKLCQSYFGKMTNPSHKLHYLLPVKRNNNLRNNANFTQFQYFSNPFKNSFIPSSVQTFNSS